MQTYTPPQLSKSARKELENGGFEFLLPYKKELYRTDEAAETIGRGLQFVRDLIELGRLEAHRDSATGERGTSLVTRRSLALYLAETSNYAPGDFATGIESLLKYLRAEELTRIAAEATRRRMAL